MSSQKSRPHETHETMAKVHQARWRGPDKDIFDRGDIGAARQVQGMEKHLSKSVGTAGRGGPEVDK